MALYKKVNGMLVKINAEDDRRAGEPRSEEERKKRHRERYGEEDLPERGTGLKNDSPDRFASDWDRKDPDGSKVNSAMDDALKYVRKQIKLGDDKASAVRSAVSNFGLTPYEKDDLMNRISGMY